MAAALLGLAAFAGSTGTAAAFVCSDPATYLVVCCPKPCMVMDVMAEAGYANETAHEVILLGQLFQHTAVMLQQVEGLAQTAMSIGRSATSSYENPFRPLPLAYGPDPSNISSVDRWSSMSAIYTPGMSTYGPTTYAPTTLLAMRSDASSAHVAALAYATSVRQLEYGAGGVGQADQLALAHAVTNAKDISEDRRAQSYVMLRILQEAQIRVEILARYTEVMAKDGSATTSADRTPDFRRQ